MSSIKDYETTIEKNKIPFEKTFGKKWNEDLPSFLSYVNGVYLAIMLNALNREIPSLSDKIDMIRGGMHELSEQVSKLR